MPPELLFGSLLLVLLLEVFESTPGEGGLRLKLIDIRLEEEKREKGEIFGKRGDVFKVSSGSGIEESAFQKAFNPFNLKEGVCVMKEWKIVCGMTRMRRLVGCVRGRGMGALLRLSRVN